MGLHEDFKAARDWIDQHLHFDDKGHVSFFETTIRGEGRGREGEEGKEREREREGKGREGKGRERRWLEVNVSYYSYIILFF